MNATIRAADYQAVWPATMANPSMIWMCQKQFVPIHWSTLLGFWFSPGTWYNFYYHEKT